jgi:hypothetical protein
MCKEFLFSMGGDGKESEDYVTSSGAAAAHSALRTELFYGGYQGTVVIFVCVFVCRKLLRYYTT